MDHIDLTSLLSKDWKSRVEVQAHVETSIKDILPSALVTFWNDYNGTLTRVCWGIYVVYYRVEDILLSSEYVIRYTTSVMEKYHHEADSQAQAVQNYLTGAPYDRPLYLLCVETNRVRTASTGFVAEDVLLSRYRDQANDVSFYAYLRQEEGMVDLLYLKKVAVEAPSL